MYPLLLRFEREGFLESEWERESSEDLGRPRRRLYRLTGAGVRAAEDALTVFSMPFSRNPQKA
jgi:PadR family transcriptional regulator